MLADMRPSILWGEDGRTVHARRLGKEIPRVVRTAPAAGPSGIASEPASARNIVCGRALIRRRDLHPAKFAWAAGPMRCRSAILVGPPHDGGGINGRSARLLIRCGGPCDTASAAALLSDGRCRVSLRLWPMRSDERLPIVAAEQRNAGGSTCAGMAAALPALARASEARHIFDRPRHGMCLGRSVILRVPPCHGAASDRRVQATWQRARSMMAPGQLGPAPRPDHRKSG